ncbi:MAG: HAMP domain-containing protein, partial [bacterium]
RNAMIIFLITGFLLIYLIFYFPERVFLPFRRMMKTLKAIAKGENNFTFPDANTKDELGELSRGVQDTISKLRYFNDLKTDKIIETERKLRRVSEEIAEPVLILSADLKISYLNEPAQKLFSLKEEVVDKDLKDIPALSDIFGEQLADIEKKGRIEFQMKNKKLSFRKKNVIIIPNINKDSKTESILIIVK